jgi:hypothetical protein
MNVEDVANHIYSSPEVLDQAIAHVQQKHYPDIPPEKIKPLFVSNPNDPRLRAYNDSLKLYNNYKYLTNPNTPQQPQSVIERLNPTNYPNNMGIGDIYAPNQDNSIMKYAKPVQPVVLNMVDSPSNPPSRGQQGFKRQISQLPVNNDNQTVSNLFKDYPILSTFSKPSDYLIQDAKGKMGEILKKNKFALEFQNKGETDYQVGNDRLKLDNPDKHRLYINNNIINPSNRADAIKLDILSHALHNAPEYNEFTKDLESKLIQKHGKEMVEGNGGVDAYIRGYLSNSKDYEPYKKEMSFLPKEYFNRLNDILANKKTEVIAPTKQPISKEGKDLYQGRQFMRETGLRPDYYTRAQIEVAKKNKDYKNQRTISRTLPK